VVLQVDGAPEAGALDDLLSRVRPVLLVVGATADPTPVRRSGNSAASAAPLRAACAVAKGHHVACTNAPLPASDLVLALWKHLRDQGQGDRAQALLDRVAPDASERLRRGDERLEEALVRTRGLLAALAAAGADAVNLAWPSADAEGLADAAVFLHGATGLPVVSTALGSEASDEQRAVLVQRAQALGLRTVLVPMAAR
jgi:hypothetical protein